MKKYIILILLMAFGVILRADPNPYVHNNLTTNFGPWNVTAINIAYTNSPSLPAAVSNYVFVVATNGGWINVAGGTATTAPSTNFVPNTPYTPWSVSTTQFGGAADGQKNRSAIVASGSATLTVTNAPFFAASDVGKVFYVAQNSTNTAGTNGTIVTFNSSTSVTLSCASAVSGTNFIFKWGTDNTQPYLKAITNCIQNGGGIVTIPAGHNEFGGPIQFYNGNNPHYTMIDLPTTPVQGLTALANAMAATNAQVSILTLGAYPPIRCYTLQSNYVSESGTIVDILAEPTNTACSFIANISQGVFPFEQYGFQNILFRERMHPQVDVINATLGGSDKWESLTFDVDVPYAGFTYQTPPTYIPPTPVTDSQAAAAIRCPVVSNNSAVSMGDIFVYGYGGGLVLSEHCHSEDLEVFDCGAAVQISLGGSQVGIVIKRCHIYCATTPFYLLKTDSGSMVDFQDIEFEEHGVTTSTFVVAANQSNILNGVLSYENEPMVGGTPAGLSVQSLSGANGATGASTYFVPSITAARLFGEAGAFTLNRGLIFDEPFFGIRNSGNQIFFNERSPNQLSGNINTNNFSYTQAPNGLGIYTSGGEGGAGGSVLYSSNVLNNLTALTIDCLVSNTSGSIVIPIEAYNDYAIFYYNNSYQSAFRLKTTNGVVTAQYNPSSGLGPFADGYWHEMTGTYDGANMVYFIDGVQVATSAQTGAITNNLQGLYLGGGSSDGISHVRIWNRALGTNEVYNLSIQQGVHYGSLDTATLTVAATGVTNTTPFKFLLTVTAGTGLTLKDQENNTVTSSMVLGDTVPLKPGWKFTGTGVTGICIQQ